MRGVVVVVRTRLDFNLLLPFPDATAGMGAKIILKSNRPGGD
jgi:hypothetical protein